MTRRRVAAGIAVAASLVGGPAWSQQPARPSSGLQRVLDSELARFPAKAGVWGKNLKTGEEAAVHADDAFNSASVIKLPVMVLAFQMADKGELTLSQRVTINASDF